MREGELFDSCFDVCSDSVMKCLTGERESSADQHLSERKRLDSIVDRSEICSCCLITSLQLAAAEPGRGKIIDLYSLVSITRPFSPI